MADKKNGGFLDGLLHDMALYAAVQASKDSGGKPDPYKATGIARGMGKLSTEDIVKLGGILGAEGTFDDED